jgi:phosphatidylethanolamine/phosphatidyl-N-methylethanolamine N-methyltransferase
MRRAFERGFARLARPLGWRPEFGIGRLERWAARHRGVRMIERRAMPPLGHFSLIRFAREDDGATSPAGRVGAGNGNAARAER